jgi:hypothetical protein
LRNINQIDIIMRVFEPPLPEVHMADVALRGMSSALHHALKKAAERSHRSLNGEILARLEASVGTSTVDVDVLLSRVHARKGRIGPVKLDEDELRGLKETGRP